MSNNFVNLFLARLDGKLPTDQMMIVSRELEQFACNYDITPRETALAVIKNFPEAYKVYMVSKKMEGRGDSTLKLYKLYLEDFFLTVNKDLNEITTNDVRLYLYQIKEKRGISDRSLDGRRLVLNGFFKWLAREGYIDHNPMDSINSIKYEAKPREPFTDIQMELLRDACETARERAILEVFYATGCRCSELAGLKKSDVDLVTREVKLFGKGRKHRVSYLTARAAVVLDKYLAERRDDNEALFVSERKPHNSLGNAGIEKILKKIGERANVTNVFPHRVRHTFATDALARGMDVVELQSLLGHEKTDTTMIYAKISTSQVKADHRKCIA